MTDETKRTAWVTCWASDEQDPPTLRPVVNYDETQPLFDFVRHNRCRDCGDGGHVVVDSPRGTALPDCRRKACVAARAERKRLAHIGTSNGGSIRAIGPAVGGTRRGK